MKSYLGTLLVAAAASIIPAVSYAQSENTAPRLAHTMSIIGQGQYFVPPEIAEFSVQVITRGDTIEEARDPHPVAAQSVRAMIETLSGQGLTLEKARYSIRETFPFQYNMSPDLTEAEKKKAVFVATTSFDLSTKRLDSLTDVLSDLATGDLLIDNIRFTVNNERAPLLEARKDAARDALEQATAYASALGIGLTEIRSITDGDATPPEYGEADLILVVGPDGKTPLSISVPDALSYSASVTVDWTIGGMTATP